MMPSALRNMPSLAAAATACRFMGEGSPSLELNTAKDKNCSVRLHGDLVVVYKLRELGGSFFFANTQKLCVSIALEEKDRVQDYSDSDIRRCGNIAKQQGTYNRPHKRLQQSEEVPRGGSSGKPRFIHAEASQAFNKTFWLRDPPEPFFERYVACRELLHHMIAQTPLLAEFGLAAADNWDDFLPHRLATTIVNKYRHNVEDDHMGISQRYDVDIPLAILVTAVYSEPKALLLACKQAATVARCQFMEVAPECCVCMEALPSIDTTADTVVVLPCSHAFHTCCLGRWFHSASTCPMCHRDMIKYLAYVTPCRGKFPGLDLSSYCSTPLGEAVHYRI